MTVDPSSSISLPPSAVSAGAGARARQACPPHLWECPVLTKLDPLAIAWTCARCGDIVSTAIGAPRPDGNALRTAR